MNFYCIHQQTGRNRCLIVEWKTSDGVTGERVLTHQQENLGLVFYIICLVLGIASHETK